MGLGPRIRLEEPPKYCKISNSKFNKLQKNIQKIVDSKAASAQKIIIPILFAFLLTFLFINVIFAADECTGINGDGDTTACSAYGTCNGGPAFAIDNTLGDCTGPSGCTTTDCCGDDNGEYYESCVVAAANEMTWEASCVAGDDACCATTSCVGRLDSNRYCYASNTGHFITGESGNDQFAYCNPSGQWRECDYGSTQCGFCDNDAAFQTCSSGTCFLAEGESSVFGDYGDGYGSGSDSGSASVSGGALSECCGDDSSEYANYRTCYLSGSSTLAGNFCDDLTSDEVCCDADDDCIYNGVCFSPGTTGVNLDGSGEADATCQSQTTFGRWVDCDLSDTWCSYCDTGTDLPNCVGTACYIAEGEDPASLPGEYADGETECCGDDSNENFLSSAGCSADGDSDVDADGDGDDDLCDSGQWKDCETDDDCSGTLICSGAQNDCVNPDGFIIIRNLGITGVENSNQEFTSTRSVMLDLNFTSDTRGCTYTNYHTTTEQPAADYNGWTPMEACVTNRLWLLSEGTGVKTVFYKINFSDRQSVFNDTINYNYTGQGLDLTPPTAPFVYHRNFTNNVVNITINWFNSTDPESITFGIPLEYTVYLYNQSDDLIAQGTTTSRQYDFEIAANLRQMHGTYLYANVTVTNSAGLTNSALSNNLYIDLIGPNMTNISGRLRNRSSDVYVGIVGEDIWVFADEGNFSWNAPDDLSDIGGYSFVLNENYQSPDDVPEGISNQFELKTHQLYDSLLSGKYYFTIKAKDLADNWGQMSSINFSVDITPPTAFEITSEEQVENDYSYVWSESTDPETGILFYRINLTDRNDVVNESITKYNVADRTYTFENLTSQNYSVVVYAFNGVGAWSSTDENQMNLDTTPPEIIVMPNRSVITNFPVIKAWTNEQATCEYSFSSNPLETTDYKFSNTTYHETKLNYTSDGHKNMTVTCTDPYGNSANANLNFTIQSSWEPDDIIIDPTVYSYEDTVESISFKLESSTNDMAGLINPDFTVKLDGKDYPFTIFDHGNSYFNLSFNNPSAGTHDVRITLYNDVYTSFVLEVSELGLYTLYEDSSITQSEFKDHISYYDGNTRIGIATEDDLVGSSVVSINSNKINISGSNTKKNVMIFNTKNAVSMADRNRKISKEKFYSLINPSFGYGISERYYITLKLVYENYGIQGDGIFKHGKHNLQIINTKPEDNTIIRVEKKTNEDRVVLSYD